LLPVRALVDGQSAASASEIVLHPLNPSNGAPLREAPAGAAQDVDAAVASARRSYVSGSWSRAAPAARKAVLARWADLIAESAPALDAVDAVEMGKPVAFAAFNAMAAAGLVRFNGEAVDKTFGTVLQSDHPSTVLQTRVPRGVVGAITPWNFPTYNGVLKAAPALAAGNSLVLKPSELANEAALMLANLALEAGVPPGVFNVVPGQGQIVGRALAEHRDVDMVTFTGSSEVGKLMLQYSGVSNMKAVLTECGGKSPHIVFDDGLDLDQVAANIAATISANSGQICSVGSRLLVQDTIEEILVQKIVACLQTIRAGDPLDPETTYGPLASQRQLDRVTRYLDAADQDGADLIYGGERILEDSGGYFLQPAVFVNVPEDSRIAQEEVFGPVLVVMHFKTLEDAIRLARSTPYGLAAYVWTTRLDVGFQISNALQTAITVVNGRPQGSLGAGFSYSGEPAGLSGLGVEGGMAGLESYMRRQTVWFNHG
jgi:acyl-CoA reductase-like NAD-dependent aldehyde dehydrogenase